MMLQQLIELYNKVYGVSNPKLQFLNYRDIEIAKGENVHVLSFPSMSWGLFKQNYYNSLLYFFDEKTICCISVAGLVYKFISSKFIHLCSIIDYFDNLEDNENVVVYFMTGEIYLGANFGIQTEIKSNKTITLSTTAGYDINGLYEGPDWQFEMSNYVRNTPILLIQFDNSVKMW